MSKTKEKRNKQEVAATETDKSIVPLNVEEEALLAKWKEKWKELHVPINFKEGENGIEIQTRGNRGTEDDKALLMRAVACELIGANDFIFALSLMQQYLGVSTSGESTDKTINEGNMYLKAMKAFNAQDDVEVMLFTQILSLQALGMKCMARAANPENSTLNVDRNVNNLTKLLRLQHETVETLNRYRRKGAQQVVVQHVQVNQGGQAVVGAIQQGGGGAIEKSGGSTP
ncbi:MAG: hypothetical protein ACH350_09670 [Parachlamydiaceae bacterium]